MKTRSIMLGAILLVLSSAAPAGGGNTLCINFTSFCDGLQLTFNPNNSITGQWVNTDCVGTNVDIIGGRLSNARARVFCTTAACPGGPSWMFDLFTQSREFDLIRWDMVSPPFPQQLNQPFRATLGACPAFTEDAGGTPSWAELANL